MASATTLSPPPQPAGLVAAYGFNEGSGTTVPDSSGNNNVGTVSGAAWTPAGRYGSALVFDGTSTRVTVPSSASLVLTTGMTLEAWVYPPVAPTGWRGGIAKKAGGYYLMAWSDQGNRTAVGGSWAGGKQTTGGQRAVPGDAWPLPA